MCCKQKYTFCFPKTANMNYKYIQCKTSRQILRLLNAIFLNAIKEPTDGDICLLLTFHHYTIKTKSNLKEKVYRTLKKRCT